MIHHFRNSRKDELPRLSKDFAVNFFLCALDAIATLLGNNIKRNIYRSKKTSFYGFFATIAIIITNVLSMCAEFKVENYFNCTKLIRNRRFEIMKLSAECVIISPNDNVSCTTCYLFPSNRL